MQKKKRVPVLQSFNFLKHVIWCPKKIENLKIIFSIIENYKSDICNYTAPSKYGKSFTAELIYFFYYNFNLPQYTNKKSIILNGQKNIEIKIKIDAFFRGCKKIRLLRCSATKEHPIILLDFAELCIENNQNLTEKIKSLFNKIFINNSNEKDNIIRYIDGKNLFKYNDKKELFKSIDEKKLFIENIFAYAINLIYKLHNIKPVLIIDNADLPLLTLGNEDKNVLLKCLYNCFDTGNLARVLIFSTHSIPKPIQKLEYNFYNFSHVPYYRKFGLSENYNHYAKNNSPNYDYIYPILKVLLGNKENLKICDILVNDLSIKISSLNLGPYSVIQNENINYNSGNCAKYFLISFLYDSGWLKLINDNNMELEFTILDDFHKKLLATNIEENNLINKKISYSIQ